jgi:hypothetical protein
MVKRNSLGSKYINVHKNNISSWRGSSRREIFTWRVDTEDRNVSDSRVGIRRPTVSEREWQNLEPRYMNNEQRIHLREACNSTA